MIKVRNPIAIINRLKKQKKAFFLFQTLYTKRIMTENETFIYNAKTTLNNNDLSFIRQVKAEAKKLQNVPKLDADDVHYIEKNDLRTFYKNEEIFEIDLNAAFWYFAHEEKFISDSLYLKGLKMPKKTRLISLGALAKKTAIIKFDGEKYLPLEFIYSYDTQGVFFRVAQRTSEMMQHLKFISQNDFLFFWCDAVFIRGEKSFNNCVEYLDGLNILFKSFKIDYIHTDGGQIFVASKDYAIRDYKEVGKKMKFIREFNFEKKTKNRTYKFFGKKNNSKKFAEIKK